MRQRKTRCDGIVRKSSRPLANASLISVRSILRIAGRIQVPLAPAITCKFAISVLPNAGLRPRVMARRERGGWLPGPATLIDFNYTRPDVICRHACLHD